MGVPPRKDIELGGSATAYLDAGDGETIVAVHGIPTSSRFFSPLLTYLTDYRVIAPDLLGQGRTASPPAGGLDHSAYARHLSDFLGVVPPPKFHFLLHDLGAILGLEWAAKNVERVDSVTLLSTTITGSFWVGTVLYAANLILGRPFLRWGMPRTLERSAELDPALLEEWAQPWSRQRLLRGQDHFAGRHLRRLRGLLSRITVPVLVLWGEQDRVFPLRHAAAIVRSLPQARLVTIPRCGHWSVLDAPEEIARSLRDFLGRRALV